MGNTMALVKNFPVLALVALLLLLPIQSWAQPTPRDRQPAPATGEPGATGADSGTGLQGPFAPSEDGAQGQAEPGQEQPGTGTPTDPQAAAPKNEVAVEPAQPPAANKLKVDPASDPNLKCERFDLNDQVRLDFKDVPLDDLIRLMSCWTGKNFMLTGGFQGKTITLMSPEPVTVAESYKAFLAVLRAHGFTVAPAGKFLKIVPDTQSKQEPIPLLNQKAGVPNDERIVTKIVKLNYIAASEISQVLGNFKGKTGEILTYGEDTLIVTDAAVMVRQLLKFVKELDIPTDKDKIWIRPIQYAEAAQIVEIITGVFSDDGTGRAGARGAAGRQAPQRGGRPGAASSPAPVAAVEKGGEENIKVTKILADERTNQLIIMCNSTTYLQVDRLLRKMDVPIPGEGQIHIYYLENADADELSSTLSSLSSGGSGRAGAPRPQGAQPRATGKAAAGGGGVAGLFEGDVKITAHKETNALIIEASHKDFLSLKRVIEKLDIRRKQVYVEAMIMEISSNKERKFGISGSAGTTFESGGETVPLLFGLGGLGVAGFDVSQLTKGGLAVGLQGPLVDVSTGTAGTSEGITGDLSIPTFGFLIQAIASNSDVNILSTPHILTTDNEEAEIQVGKQIPYRASTFGGLSGLSGLSGLTGLTGGATSGLASSLGGLGAYGGLLGGLGGGMVQRIDVDLTLKITPHVNESNYVRLEIEQSVEDVESIDRELGPTTSKRKVNNTVVVKDQQPVVIGGLIRDTESEGVDKVPFLGDVPLIGVFFRKTVKKVEKKNLLMIIVPHIIDDPSDLSRIHTERMEEIRRLAEYLATKENENKGIVDYHKKNGGLEAMRQVVDRAKKTREAREKAEFDDAAVDLVGPPETHDLDYDPTQPAGGAGQGAPGGQR